MWQSVPNLSWLYPGKKIFITTNKVVNIYFEDSLLREIHLHILQYKSQTCHNSCLYRDHSSNFFGYSTGYNLGHIFLQDIL
jgi:hypothetical protein